MTRHSYRTIDLFAGIGGIRLGFVAHGCQTVFAADWDTDAQKMYMANFGDFPAGDITKIIPATIPDHDILLAGFPCQPFSIIGQGKGFDDSRGTLFFHIEEILKTKQPDAFLLENVKQLKTHDRGRTFQIINERLHELGYYLHSKVLNALDFGLPQKRERLFIVGFRHNLQFEFPEVRSQITTLSDILESEDRIDPKLFASRDIVNKRLAKIKQPPFYPSIWHENKGGNISILPFSCALRSGASYNYLLVNGNRRLTPREMLRLQGFPEDFKIVGTCGVIRKLAGNTVAVPVVTAIAGEIIKALDLQKEISEVKSSQQALLLNV
jgi:DNA (cytosine-5)-methyltransferase 1